MEISETRLYPLRFSAVSINVLHQFGTWVNDRNINKHICNIREHGCNQDSNALPQIIQLEVWSSIYNVRKLWWCAKVTAIYICGERFLTNESGQKVSVHYLWYGTWFCKKKRLFATVKGFVYLKKQLFFFWVLYTTINHTQCSAVPLQYS